MYQHEQEAKLQNYRLRFFVFKSFKKENVSQLGPKEKKSLT